MTLIYMRGNHLDCSTQTGSVSRGSIKSAFSQKYRVVFVDILIT